MKEYANHIGYSDINPFEVIHTLKSGKTKDIREMCAERSPDWKPQFEPGGFSTICTNQNTQRWDITQNVDGRVVRIRLHKDGWWRDRNGDKYKLMDRPVKFYDYNF